ncbi:type II toxin-antitoxin system tRNA(fMet)-specific endonuclease VapC [Methylomonas fluvii]|uniref:Ribonuclease VapC n=1 Tax=Methylomonas fluvii TaxID=1854564 RepID=A0ABR9DD13_9GAMM|nr:type II toxin-antitoxin system VapC family toxin [Methylomonas fluvii]MBD9360977.1 type II toxin-antitoxin system VapC family toxin [Methylomonas fluvii]
MPVRYLLDTNICIYIAKHRPPAVRERFARHSASELAMSVITLGELRFGAEKSQARERAIAIAALAELTGLIPVCELPEPAGDHYGQIRAELQKIGQPIGNNDLWLAAQARSQDWILVTNNERDFLRVPGLWVENWVN